MHVQRQALNQRLGQESAGQRHPADEQRNRDHLCVDHAGEPEGRELGDSDADGDDGAGIILLSLLMAAGLEGAAVVATDAVISIGIGLAKFATFGLAGVVNAKVVAIALLIGGVALPGAFLAKALIERLPLHVHTAILDAVVIGGGAVMIVNAFVR